MNFKDTATVLALRQLIWLCILALTLLAGWIDWHRRLIPNWITAPGVLLGIAANFLLGGRHGVVVALEGALLALALLLPLVLLRAVGAGDWKLMGAVGAFLGPWAMLVVLFVSFLLSAIMGLYMTVRANQVGTTFRNLWILLKGFFVFGLRPNPQVSLDTPGLLKLPFGVAVAAAVIICFVGAHFGTHG